jgi:hypothetical protein
MNRSASYPPPESVERINDSTCQQFSIGLLRLSTTLEFDAGNGRGHAEGTPDAGSAQRRQSITSTG